MIEVTSVEVTDLDHYLPVQSGCDLKPGTMMHTSDFTEGNRTGLSVFRVSAR